MFKLLGILLAVYCAYAVSEGSVSVKSGLWGRTVTRAESPEYFWVCVSIYLGLSIALLTGF
jgi:hypothetical protein